MNENEVIENISSGTEGKRKRSRPFKYSPESQTTKKKQRLLSFGSLMNGASLDSPVSPQVLSTKPKRVSRKKGKTSTIPALQFFAFGKEKPSAPPAPVQKNSVELSVEASKIFNQIVTDRKGEQELHPFFKQTNTQTTKTHPSHSVSNEKQHKQTSYEINDALAARHYQYDDSPVPFTVVDAYSLDLLDLETELEDTNSAGPIECERLSKIVNISDTIALINQRISSEQPALIEKSDDDDEDISVVIPPPLIDIELYGEDVKHIQSSLLQTFNLHDSDANTTASISSLLSLFDINYYQRSSHISSSCDDMLWNERYKARAASECFSDPHVTQQFYHWLQFWKHSDTNSISNNQNDERAANWKEKQIFLDARKESKSYKGFLIQSDYPRGKSSLVYAVARELGYKVVEFNSADLRNGRLLNSLHEATQSRHLSVSEQTEENKLILFDDFDVRFADESGFYSSLCNLLEQTKQPIVMTCGKNVPTDIAQKMMLIFVCPMTYSVQLHQFLSERHILFSMLAEFQKTPHLNDFARICTMFKHDLRKIMLCLQFWSHPGICLRNHDTNSSNLLEKIVGLHYDATKPIRDNFERLEYDTVQFTPCWSQFPYSNYPFNTYEYQSKRDKLEEMKELSRVLDVWGAVDQLSCPLEEFHSAFVPTTKNSFSMSWPTDFKISQSSPEDECEPINQTELFSFADLTRCAKGLLIQIIQMEVDQSKIFSVDIAEVERQRKARDAIRQQFSFVQKFTKKNCLRSDALDYAQCYVSIFRAEKKRKEMQQKRRFQMYFSNLDNTWILEKDAFAL